jgi:transcriptional regulator with XRE-family HTH domain
MRWSVNRPEYVEIVGYLLGLRKRAKLTQVELATKLRWKQQYISTIENKHRRMDLLQAAEYARACGSNMREVGAAVDSILDAKPTPNRRTLRSK